MLSAWLGSDMYQSLSHWFDSTSVRTRDGPSTHSAMPSGLILMRMIGMMLVVVVVGIVVVVRVTTIIMMTLQ